ncbi:XdhC family protein [Pusillimonas sp.]|uniref:XdhC family protein n=1 Tax=Pusillimonas sp. TaxID=3040095 RepID=UPI0037CC0ADE
MNPPSFNAALLAEALQLSERNQPYAWATVVRAAPPSSAYVGAQAIVTADGILHGWVGGGCARDIVVRSCLEAMQSRNSKLVRISNEGGISDPGTEHHAMPCASNGALDLFIQPVNPGPALYIAGVTPAAKAAEEFVAMLGWRVLHGDPAKEALCPDYVLVATQGDDDIGNLERALRSAAKKVLLIASTRKAESLRESMRYLGITEARLADLEGPAGPDILAESPSEVALAAVAGLVRAHRRAAGMPQNDTGQTDVQKNDTRQADTQQNDMRQADAPQSGVPAMDTQEARRTGRHNAADGIRGAAPAYVNPVCLRPIDPATALHTIFIGNSAHYFCCDGCKIKFEADPARYLGITAPAPNPEAT